MNKSEFFLGYDKEIKGSIPCYDIEIPLYKCTLKVMSISQTKRLNKLWKQESDEYSMRTNNYLSNNGTILIRIKEWSIPSMVHELHHVVTMIMDRIGHIPQGDADEPSAYLLAHLTKLVLKKEKQLSK